MSHKQTLSLIITAAAIFVAFYVLSILYHAYIGPSYKFLLPIASDNSLFSKSLIIISALFDKTSVIILSSIPFIFAYTRIFNSSIYLSGILLGALFLTIDLLFAYLFLGYSVFSNAFIQTTIANIIQCALTVLSLACLLVLMSKSNTPNKNRQQDAADAAPLL